MTGENPHTPPTKLPEPGLMHHLGAFFGHVAKAVKADVTKTTQVVQQQTTQAHVDTPVGPGTHTVSIKDEVEARPSRQGQPGQVIARRITTEEVRVSLPAAPSSNGSSKST